MCLRGAARTGGACRTSGGAVTFLMWGGRTDGGVMTVQRGAGRTSGGAMTCQRGAARTGGVCRTSGGVMTVRRGAGRTGGVTMTWQKGAGGTGGACRTNGGAMTVPQLTGCTRIAPQLAEHAVTAPQLVARAWIGLAQLDLQIAGFTMTAPQKPEVGGTALREGGGTGLACWTSGGTKTVLREGGRTNGGVTTVRNGAGRTGEDTVTCPFRAVHVVLPWTEAPMRGSGSSPGQEQLVGQSTKEGGRGC